MFCSSTTEQREIITAFPRQLSTLLYCYIVDSRSTIPSEVFVALRESVTVFLFAFKNVNRDTGPAYIADTDLLLTRAYIFISA